jgi:hypothetical protein
MKKIKLTPDNTGKITLFNHWGEAVVFWISCACVLMLGLFLLFRYVQLRTEISRYEFTKNQTISMQENIDEIRAMVVIQNSKINILKKQVDTISNSIK